MTDSTTNKAVYTNTPRDLPIPKDEHDFISLQQNATSVTPHADNDWVQTGTGGGATAQTLIQVANKRLFIQNPLAPGGGSPNEVKVRRSGVYKAIYSAEVEFAIGEASSTVELGIGSSGTSGTSIVNNVPLERASRVQGSTSTTVTEHVTGSVVLRLGNDTVLRFYDRVIGAPINVNILNADIVIQREGRDGQ